MSEHQTNPSAPATLFLRFETEMGPRTVVCGNLTVRDASAILEQANSNGIFAAYVEERARASLVSMLAKIKRERRRTALTLISRPENITSLAQARKGRGA